MFYQKREKIPIVIGMIFFLFLSCKQKEKIQNYVLEGSLKKWEPLTLTFEGPQISMADAVNPFLDYALLVNFHKDKETFKVHGYYTADHNKVKINSEEANTWEVKFSPNLTGEWQFEAYLVEGSNIGVAPDPMSKKKKAVWRSSGKFEVTPRRLISDWFL